MLYETFIVRFDSAGRLSSMLHLPKLKTERERAYSKRDYSNESMLSWKKGARDGYAFEYWLAQIV